MKAELLCLWIYRFSSQVLCRRILLQYFILSMFIHLSFLQVLINGLQHFVSKDVKPKVHIVETFIKVMI